jgi:hypothetical protein
MNETEIKELIEAVFVKAGFRACTIDTNETPLFRIYEGTGMVWGISILNSFDMFARQWSFPNQGEAKVTTLLAKASNIDEKWNLTVLVLVLEPITEAVLPLISKFQEDPSAYARFVLAVNPETGLQDLKDRIGFLLLSWLDTPSGVLRDDVTIERDMETVVRQVASHVGVLPLDSMASELVDADPDPQRLITALQNDLQRNSDHETH